MKTVTRTRARLLVALTLPLTLAGCLDVEEDVRLHADGRVSYRCVVDEPVSLKTLGPDLTQGLRRRLQGDPAVLRLESATSKTGETLRTVIDAELKPSSQGGEAFELEGFRVEPLGGRRFRITRTLGAAKSTAAETPPKADPLGELLTRRVLGEHGYTLRLHAPRIVSANGAVDPSGTSVEWKVAWNDLKGAALTAEVELGEPIGAGWLVVVGLLTCAAAVLVVLRRRLLGALALAVTAVLVLWRHGLLKGGLLCLGLLVWGQLSGERI